MLRINPHVKKHLFFKAQIKQAHFQKLSILVGIALSFSLFSLQISSAQAMERLPWKIKIPKLKNTLIQGRVVEQVSSSTQKPVSGALVEVFVAASSILAGSGMSNANGDYTITGKLNGEYYLKVSQKDYQTQTTAKEIFKLGDTYKRSFVLQHKPPKDTIPPVTRDSGIDGLWHNQAVTVILKAEDNLSGIAKTYYSLNGSTPGILYQRPIVVSKQGVYRLRYYSKDKAGNIERIKSAAKQIKIDTQAPVLTLNPIPSPTDIPQQTISGSYKEENLEKIEINGIPAVLNPRGKTYTLDVCLNSGENKLVVTAVDKAGSQSSVSLGVYLYTGELIKAETGGTVYSLDRKAELNIPAGALSKDTYIGLRAVIPEELEELLPAGKELWTVVECSPKGLSFNPAADPVQLTYRFSQAQTSGTAVELGLYDEALKKITILGEACVGAVDNYSVSFVITHFSTYGAITSLIPNGAAIGAGVQIPLPDMLTGAFSQSIGISVPPGRKSIQPEIRLTYRSSNPNSWTGAGFSLNPGYIVRSTRLGPATYNDTQDTFYFITDAGTTELINLVDNLYQAKVESGWTKFFKESDDSWKAVTKDGVILRFGQTAESKETSDCGTFSWYLSRTTDTNGNYIQYYYTKDQGKSYLSRIDWTGNELGISAANSAEFFLEPREDIPSSYISSAKAATAKRLKEIQVKANNELVWEYKLEYEYSADTHRSLLKSVRQYGADGKCMPVQSFEYQGADG